MSSSPSSGAERPHLALVGLSGTGKSSLTPLLAARRGLVAVDLDERIERRSGRSVADVFAEQGEPAFRALESLELADALAGPPAVIATGGGVVVDAANRALIRECCEVVWLRTTLETLIARLRASQQERPLLAGDAETTLRRLAEEREALYMEVATHVIDTDGRAPTDVVRDIEAVLGRG